MELPKNWPRQITYLAAPLLDKNLTPTQLQTLRSKPAHDDTSISVAPAAPPRHANRLVKIMPITDRSHPACGQCGLFAAQNLRPGDFIALYLGRVHNSSAGNARLADSDFDLWIDHGAGIAVDGGREGNEARFINDYRGVPETRRKNPVERNNNNISNNITCKAGPNAEFKEVWSADFRMRCMAVYSLPRQKRARTKSKGMANSTGPDGIPKGEEILVSYGKGFWDKRASGDIEEEEEEEEEGEGSSGQTVKTTF